MSSNDRTTLGMHRYLAVTHPDIEIFPRFRTSAARSQIRSLHQHTTSSPASSERFLRIRSAPSSVVCRSTRFASS